MASADMAFEIVESGDASGLALIGREFFGGGGLQAFSFLIFYLLCAPCFAAMGAIRREMNNAKWTIGAISYMTAFAYAVSLIAYRLGRLFTGGGFDIWTVVAIAILCLMVYLLVRPDRYKTKKL